MLMGECVKCVLGLENMFFKVSEVRTIILYRKSTFCVAKM